MCRLFIDTVWLLVWIDFFEKCELQIAWGFYYSNMCDYFFGTVWVLVWIDFFEKCGLQIAWGLKSCVLVPRYHVPNIN
jgi:hypothetical protein